MRKIILFLSVLFLLSACSTKKIYYKQRGTNTNKTNAIAWGIADNKSKALSQAKQAFSFLVYGGSFSVNGTEYNINSNQNKPCFIDNLQQNEFVDNDAYKAVKLFYKTKLSYPMALNVTKASFSVNASNYNQINQKRINSIIAAAKKRYNFATNLAGSFYITQSKLNQNIYTEELIVIIERVN